MEFYKRGAWLLFFMLSYLPINVFASSGALQITLVDQHGHRIADAEINISSHESITEHHLVTNQKGRAYINGLFPSSKYQVKIEKLGYQTLSIDNLKVISGKLFSHRFELVESTETIEVIQITRPSNPLAIDTRSAQVSTDITLDVTESLPTGRSYQSYLQLVPGTTPSANGNPSSKSGINYANIGGVIGNSSDNVYILDGINVTDNQDGGFGANINSEIIQELQVLTGGIPAEFEGGSGLISKVLTKSGSNEFTGSINYYFQDNSLVSDNQFLKENNFSNYDAAMTLGGPLIEDKLWFFTSYQEKSNRKDITHLDSGKYMRSIDEKSELFFIKLTAELSDTDLIEFSYFRDPTNASGSSDQTKANNRDFSTLTGGKNYRLEYRKELDDLLVRFQLAKHEGEHSLIAKNRVATNNLAYKGEHQGIELEKGGLGYDRIQFRNRRDIKLDAEYYLDTEHLGTHIIKTGFGFIDNDNMLDEVYVDSGRYKSISRTNSGASLADYTSPGWLGDININTDDYGLIAKAVQNDPQLTELASQMDTDANGTISPEELSQGIIFNSTTANPHGDINVYRNVQKSPAPIRLEVDGKAFYVQDQINFGAFTISAGLRAEKWTHKNSNGEKLISFGWDIAPRLSGVFAVNDRSKLWAFSGRYYDPIRTNMTFFTGNVSGPSLEDQVFVDDKWLTYRIRGGANTEQAMFAPTIETPYTDEFMLGYSTLLGEDMSLEFTYTKRETHNLIEDYFYDLYTHKLKGTDFHLSEQYFGIDKQSTPNYVIANLAGGVRKYRGFEIKFDKYHSNRWTLSTSYTYNDASGNSNSDSNVNFQGDFVWLDPRAPNQYGRQAGSIKHLFKAYTNYKFDNGVELGAFYRWNSGTYYTKAWKFAGRYLPKRADSASRVGGVNEHWVDPTAVGQSRTPSYGVLDLRIKYRYDFGHLDAEFFVDIFNVFDNQAVINEQSLYLGNSRNQFGDGTDWVEPRRLYLGTRLNF